MSFSVVLNGTSYSLPEVNDINYGDEVNTYLEAIADECLQPTGGTFTLTDNVDFGSSYGISAAYFNVSSILSVTDATLTAESPNVVYVDNPTARTITMPLTTTCPGKIFYFLPSTSITSSTTRITYSCQGSDTIFNWNGGSGSGFATTSKPNCTLGAITVWTSDGQGHWIT